MEQWEIEFQSYRIMSGKTRIMLEGSREVVLFPSSIDTKISSSLYYSNILENCYQLELLTEQDALEILESKNIWTPLHNSQLSLLTGKIEDFKVGLFENWAHSNNRYLIRKALNDAREEISRLENLKHSLDHITCEGVAIAAKARYLTGFSLRDSHGNPIWKSIQDMELSDDCVDEVIEYLVKHRLSESNIREISRNDPWRSYWTSAKSLNQPIFSSPVLDLTDEQKYLIMWSNVYDSIRESGECPEEEIIADDDMLDGWMIKQRRDREKDRIKKRGDEISNERIRNSDEVYLMVDKQDANKIGQLNDPVAKTIKSQRLALLRNKGVVNEMEMPDTWARFQMEASQAATQAIKSR